MKITVYVCPQCRAWSDVTASGHPLYSTCEHDGHPQAIPVEFTADDALINPKTTGDEDRAPSRTTSQ